APEAYSLALEIAFEMRIEELVVAQLVGGDMLADRLEHGLLDRFGERTVIRAGAGLDDAARDQFAGACAAHGPARTEVDAKPGGEPRRRLGMIEPGIDQLGPAAERLAVLDLFLAPAARHFLEARIITENVAEVMGVVAAILLDQACR